MASSPEGRTGDLLQDWKKSSYSHATGNCVEVAGLSGRVVGVRDSLDPQGGILRFAPVEWGSFVTGVRNGQFS